MQIREKVLFWQILIAKKYRGYFSKITENPWKDSRNKCYENSEYTNNFKRIFKVEGWTNTYRFKNKNTYSFALLKPKLGKSHWKPKIIKRKQ